MAACLHHSTVLPSCSCPASPRPSGTSRPSTTSPSRSSAASSSRCWARPAAARRPRSGCSPASRSPTRTAARCGSSARWSTRSGPTSARSRWCSRATRCSPTSRSQRNVAFGLEQRKTPEGRDRRPGPQGAGDGPARARHLRPPHAGPALRRAAAAGRAGAGAGAGARHPAARRAAGRDRPQAPQGDAARAQVAQQAARHHLRLRHPRPGRSAHDVRPHRGHGQRARRAAGHAGGDLRESAHRVRGQVHRRVELLRRQAAERRPGGSGEVAAERRRAISVVPDHPALSDGKARPDRGAPGVDGRLAARRGAGGGERGRRHHPRRHLPGRDDARAS